MKIITVFCFTIISTTIAVPSLPSNFKLCKRSDPNVSECLTNAVKEAIIFLGKGLESFKIMPLESLKFTLNLNGTTTASTSLNQEYRNTVLYGLTKNLDIHDFQIDWNNSVMKFYGINEQFDILSDYKLRGRVLVVPIYGDGKCKMSAYNITANHELYFETFGKDGESYIRVKKYVLKCNAKRAAMHFDNLFDGNEILGAVTNKFLADNGLLLFNEFKPFFEESIAKSLLEISNQVFTHVPMNKIFPLT